MAKLCCHKLNLPVFMVENSSIIQAAVAALKQGQLVAFPTETVYGLGADAKNSKALSLLYEVKGRPAKHPCIVHIGSLKELNEWCPAVPESALLLGTKFWPGPLTLVLKKAPAVLPELTGGQETIALRMPAHETALGLLGAFGSGIAAPSANRFGRLSPTAAEDVRAEFGDTVKLVLDGGHCRVGIESTIVDLSSPIPRILRPGMILHEDIAGALSELRIRIGEGTGPAAESPRVPGSLPAHYAPQTSLTLVDNKELSPLIRQLEAQGKAVAVMSLSAPAQIKGTWIQVSSAPGTYAQEMYRHLRRFDQSGKDIILVEKPPFTSAWVGINDRLKRAAGQRNKPVEGADG